MNKNKIMVITTGGTIAGTGKNGAATGYCSGQLKAEQLTRAVSGLENVADIELLNYSNINSDDISDKDWLSLAAIINENAKRDDIAGIVVTHGTDTLEETAFFLHMTVKTDKPVVMTGSMRPATALSADGPINLYQAVLTAANPASKGRGVLIVFSNYIYSARYLVKNNANAVNAVSGGIQGCMGTVIDDEIFYHCHIDKPHTTATDFDIAAINRLKKVQVIYFSANADKELLNFALSRYDGIVIAGAGMGEYSLDFLELIGNASIPVVITTKTGSGIVTPKSLLSKNTIAAYDLSAQKATVLLQLALTICENVNTDKLREIFMTY